MKKVITLTLLALISLIIAVSCNRVKDKAKETINKGGEAAGKAATEFIEGVTEGVDKTLQCELALSDALKEAGLKTGKFSVGSDSTGGENNKLSVYIIFEKDFKKNITLKIFDKAGLEGGRTNIPVEGKAGQANYYDIVFDKRTNIDVKSKILFE